MDDIRPPRQPGNQSSYPSQANRPSNSGEQPVLEPPESDNGYNNPNDSQYKISPQKPKKSKGLVVALVIFIILSIAAAGFAAWLYFVEMKNMQTEIDDLKKDNARLVSEVRSLQYDNRDLSQKLLLEQQNNSQIDNQQVPVEPAEEL